MKIGAQLRNVATWEQLRAVAETADRLRFSSLWDFDHMMPIGPNDDEAGRCLEAWTLLSSLAVVTRRIGLGCLVSAVTFRNPALLAKMAATVDEISGGRLELGLGAAWHEREHEAYGFPFPSVAQRQDMLEEAARVTHDLFRGDLPMTLEGRFHRYVRTPFAPRRAIPIMIGGGGEKRTLRTLALYGDVMNVFGTPPEVKAKIEILERHCADVGRDPGEIRRTATVRCGLLDDPAKADDLARRMGYELDTPEGRRYVAVGNADQVADALRAYEGLVDEVLLQMLPMKPEVFERIDREVLGALV